MFIKWTLVGSSHFESLLLLPNMVSKNMQMSFNKDERRTTLHVSVSPWVSDKTFDRKHLIKLDLKHFDHSLFKQKIQRIDSIV